VNDGIVQWIKSMDDETRTEMGTFIPTLSDYNIHMLPTEKSVSGIMKYIYDHEQDIIIESLYSLRYYLHINDVTDADIIETNQVNYTLSKSKLFTDDLKSVMLPVDDYINDHLFALLFLVRMNISVVLNNLKDN
jgi:hypothetical protein